MSKPIRILHIFSRLDRGGAESMIMNIYRNIDRNKIQFDFVVHTNDICAFDDEIKKLGGNIYRVSQYKLINHVTYIEEFENLFKKNEFTIIHSHIRSTASLILKVAKEHNIITISHSHSTSNGYGIKAIIKNIMQKNIVKYADYLFAASQKAGAWLFGSEIILNKNIYIIKNAIENQKFTYNSKIRNSKRLELGVANELVIGHIGNFKEVKNHSFLIKIFKKFNEKNPTSKLLLVGDGELKEEILKLVTESNLLDKVIILGSRSDVNELLQAIDIIVFPSLYEGLPVTIIEAQAAGLPCLLSDTITDEVAITEAVEFMSLHENEYRWVESITSMLKGYKRKNNYDIIRQTGYDVNDLCLKLENAYYSILNNKEFDFK